VSKQFRQFEFGTKGSFMIRTSNVTNVETVDTAPTLDNQKDYPTASGHSVKPLRKLQQAEQFRVASGSGNVGA